MINMPLFLDTAHDNLNMEFIVMENLIFRWNVEKKVNLKDINYLWVDLESEWYYGIIKVLQNLHYNFLEFSQRKKNSSNKSKTIH